MNDDDRKWSAGCYVPVFNLFICALTAVRKVDSKFCLFHMRQGLVLFALILFILLIGFVSSTLSVMLWGVALLLHGAGAYFAFNGRDTSIPVVAGLASKIPEYYLFKLLTGKEPEIKKDDNADQRNNNS